MNKVKTISPAELHRLAESGARLRIVDVRTPVEFREVHVPGAENIPLDRLESALRDIPPNGPMYLLCRTGSRAQSACLRFADHDHLKPVVVEGGTEAWQSAGYDVVRGKKAMSLERQVRIAAGSLVVLGVVLSLAVHPAFIGLSAFVGAGLVFAGVTDTCAMGMLIARMPWNQIRSEEAACSR